MVFSFEMSWSLEKLPLFLPEFGLYSRGEPAGAEAVRASLFEFTREEARGAWPGVDSRESLLVGVGIILRL